jgi:translation initiation factor 2D
VSAAHPDIKSIEFSPAVIAELQKARDRPSAEAKKRAAAAAAAAAAGRIKVLTMYMPSNSLKRVLFAAHPHGTLFTMGEAKHVLWEYVKAHQLERGGGRAVAIDEVLFDALFKNNKGAAKAGAVAEVGSELAKQALSTRFEAEMAAYHALVREGEEAQADFRRGKLPQVEVVTERRQGTKVVTRLSNLEVFGVDPAAVAKHAQKVFACSATVQPSLLKDSKLRDVLVQGSVLGQVEAVLTDEFGIPPNLVVSRDSAAKKKKKK